MPDAAFLRLRPLIDHVLDVFGLSQPAPYGTHLGDIHEGGHREEPDETPQRELHNGDAEQRVQAPVPRLRSEGGDKPGGRRVLPVDSVPVVRLAQRAEGDVVDATPCWAKLEWANEQITHLENEVSRRDVVLDWLEANAPQTLALCPYKVVRNA